MAETPTNGISAAPESSPTASEVVVDMSGDVEARSILEGDDDGSEAQQQTKSSPEDATGSPFLTNLRTWGKQANANAKDFWSKRKPLSETFKSALPITSASLDASSPKSVQSNDSQSSKGGVSTLSKDDAETAEEKKTDSSPINNTEVSASNGITDASSPASSSPDKKEPGAASPASASTEEFSVSRSVNRDSHKSINRDKPVPLKSITTSRPSFIQTSFPASMNSLLSPSTNAATPASARSDASSFLSYDDDASSYWSSTYDTASDAGNMGGTFKWAAASVVDSVSNSYRGRYNRTHSDNEAQVSNNSNLTSSPLLARTNSAPVVASNNNDNGKLPTQTHRIMQSRARHHLQELMDQLDPNEYLMLLGEGRLGVNLKSTYLQKGGVYVDYLVQGGAAFQSGIIRPGDALHAVGPVNVRRGNIFQVPQEIAQAKRPVHLVFATGNTRNDTVNYVDIGAAILHTLVETTQRTSVVRFASDPDPISATPSVVDDNMSVITGGETAPMSPAEASLVETIPEEAGDSAEEKPESGGVEESKVESDPSEEEEDVKREKEEGVGAPPESNKDTVEDEVEQPSEISSPTMELVRPTSFDLADKNVPTTPAAAERLPDLKETPNCILQPQVPSVSLREAFVTRGGQRCNEVFYRADKLWSTHGSNTNLIKALKHSFCLTTADGRRLPFLVRHWSQQEEDPTEMQESPREGDKESPSQHSPNMMLMLYLEIYQFVDLYHVTPAHRRLEIAQKIANKFFLPMTMGDGDFIPPMLDFHKLVSQSSLRQLENVLKSAKEDNSVISQDLFDDFLQAVMDSMTGLPFLEFLVSDECSRMRAYLRNTAPFLNVPLHSAMDQVVASDNHHAHNYLQYIMVYLVGLTDPEEIGETDELVDVDKERRSRVEDAAAPICATLFIRRTLLPAIHKFKKEGDNMTVLWKAWEQFWELFLSPTVGSLESTSLSAETTAKVQLLRSDLDQMCAPCRVAEDGDQKRELVVTPQITDSLIVDRLELLAENLLYDYAVICHSKFRMHKYHEWMCQEAAAASSDGSDVESDIPKLSSDCIKRLMRKAHFPIGVSTHKPHRLEEVVSTPNNRPADECIAECALVFGTDVGSGDFSIAGQDTDVRRYLCESFSDVIGEGLLPEELPPTFEGYAAVPNTNIQFQQAFHDYQSTNHLSVDGWELSLLNFKVPRAQDDADASLYGVSLVLRRAVALPSSTKEDEAPISTFVESSADVEKPIRFEGSIEGDDLRRIVSVNGDCALFNSKLNEQSWSEKIPQNALVGVALVSRHNAIPSMRQALSSFLRDFTGNGPQRKLVCTGLADFLGHFGQENVEPDVLRNMLQPYLKESIKPWLERPFAAQQEFFEQEAGEQLVQNLPPIPMALMFITALMEQKMVITGSRRSVLLSATTALAEMLKPLKWCHLMVPRVPAKLAADLLQYPAPFILGMPAQDPGILELIRDLPGDITLVDLDVGRVILASSFATDNEFSRGTPKNSQTARALRTQVLSLAQCLGNVFGACIDPLSWCCDKVEHAPGVSPRPTRFDALKAACHDFLEELLAGSTSCCYWIEEATGDRTAPKSEATTVLFDEDRFFRIKHARHKERFRPLLSPVAEGSKLAMDLENFHLVLEILLRCQSINAYLGTRRPEEMIFS